MTQNHWYALHTKPYKEPFITDQLTQKAISFYYPTIEVGPKIKPFFPGYLFVQADLARLGSGFFNYLRGAYGLVAFGGEAAVIPEAVIASVQASVTLYQASPAGGIVPGTPVEVTSGPFAGYDGVFDRYKSGRERVQILLSFLGTTRPVTMAADGMVVMVSDL